MVTVHRFSSISEQRSKQIPRPPRSLFIYFYSSESVKFELEEEEEEKTEEWRGKVEEEDFGGRLRLEMKLAS